VDVSKLKETILEVVKNEGPVLPVAVSRKLGRDTYFAGAVLSELVNNKSIRISSAKIGGSPLYYVNGQENKLDKLYDYLPEREKEAYELLRKNQVLKDSECQPAIRVALRSIKDFAFAFDVNDELHWRWYLITEEEGRNLIGDIKPKKRVKIERKERKLVPKEDTYLDLIVSTINKINEIGL